MLCLLGMRVDGQPLLWRPSTSGSIRGLIVVRWVLIGTGSVLSYCVLTAYGDSHAFSSHPELTAQVDFLCSSQSRGSGGRAQLQEWGTLLFRTPAHHTGRSTLRERGSEHGERLLRNNASDDREATQNTGESLYSHLGWSFRGHSKVPDSSSEQCGIFVRIWDGLSVDYNVALTSQQFLPGNVVLWGPLQLIHIHWGHPAQILHPGGSTGHVHIWPPLCALLIHCAEWQFCSRTPVFSTPLSH